MNFNGLFEASPGLRRARTHAQNRGSEKRGKNGKLEGREATQGKRVGSIA